jgi:hypothetical protein
MQALKLLFILTIISLFSSCGESFYTYEIDPETKDTINRRNENGKQGPWFEKLCTYDMPGIPLNGTDSSNSKSMPIVHDPVVMEEGNYVDDRKQGTWRYYHKDGSLHHTLEFTDGCPEKGQAELSTK